MNRKKLLKGISLILSILFAVSCFTGITSATESDKSSPSIEYVFALPVAGMAQGSVIVDLPDGDTDNPYELYWGNSNGILDGYSYLATTDDFRVGETTLVYNVPERVVIPPQATHLWLVLDGTNVSCYEIPEERRASLGELKYSFGVTSDTHVFNNVDDEAEFRSVLDVFSGNNATFAIIAGDVVGAGRAAYYATLNSVVADENFDAPIFIVPGNHDVLRRWNDEEPSVKIGYMRDGISTYGNEDFTEDANSNAYKVTKGDTVVDYTVEFGDDLFVYLGIGMVNPEMGDDSQTDQHLSPTQIEWLKNVFDNADDYDNVFLTFHYATFESGFASYANTDWSWEYDGYMTEGYSSAQELYNILKDHPNVVMFSGHTHRSFDSDKNLSVTKNINFNYEDYTWTEGNDPLGFTAVHVPTSQIYQAYVVNVYNTGVLLTGYYTDTGKIVSHANFYLPNTISSEIQPIITNAPDGVVTGESIDLSVKNGIEVEWSVIKGEDICTIDSDGKLTATEVGTIIVKASAVDSNALTMESVDIIAVNEHLSGGDVSSATVSGSTIKKITSTYGKIYVDGGNSTSGQSVAYNVYVNKTGTYYAGIQFCTTATRGAKLLVNGTGEQSLSFAKNNTAWGSDESTKWNYRMATVELQRGENVIELISDGSSKMPQLADLVILEADNWYTSSDAYTLTGNMQLKDCAYGLDGKTFDTGNTLGMVNWAVKIPVSGKYKLSVAYSTSSGGTSNPIKVLVNDVQKASINRVATSYSYGSAWGFLETDEIFLEAGEYKITLQGNGGAYFGGVGVELVERVIENVKNVGLQEAINDNSVRLVGEIYGTAFDAAGFEIKISYTDKDGKTQVSSEELAPEAVHTAYTSIKAGSGTETPSEDGYYLIVLEISEIPTDAQELIITFKPYVKSDGITEYGETYVYGHVAKTVTVAE